MATMNENKPRSQMLLSISRYQPTALLGQGDCVNISAAYSDYLSSPENGVTADEVASVQKMKEVHRKQARPGERLGLVPICLTLVAMNFRSWAYVEDSFSHGSF
ncbi:hypothetical protein D9613_010258 [Agrocybe pediades]|uniref:Uncharacterized protein n=1 Tax=Agrocybe pediades TaxID=84607 RepID=A0A8H4QGW1_9AGAR|nr:hypothetical protein D9613_010258 [Agrocybe pediades]